jgi:gluconate 2-dehydrogenase gamma chain
MAETRRDALKIIGAVGATCAFPFSADELYGQTAEEHAGHSQMKPPAVPAAPYVAVFFTPDEYALISHITEMIIPATDTPGAIGAGVPQYIDLVVSQSTDLQKRYREGMPWLNEKAGGAVLKSGEEQQLALLTPLSEAAYAGNLDTPGARFFQTIKNMTADGYYTSYPGLVQELGYHGNVALASFPGCVHEH